MERRRKSFSTITPLMMFIMVFAILSVAHGENLGAGSYVTSGYSSPAGYHKVTSGFGQPIQTNDWWSSLIWNYNVYNDQPYSQPMFPHPLGFQAQSGGLDVVYPDFYTTGSEYHYNLGAVDLTIGVSGLSADETKTASYSDWAVTAQWDGMMQTTIGHGFPFVYVTKLSDNNASVTFPTGAPDVWYNENGVVGLTVNGHHYGIFGPTGSSWTGGTVLESNLNGNNYFSIAVLPDSSLETLEFFRQHAYSFITGTQVSWNYDEASAQVTSTFTAAVSQKETGQGIGDNPLLALYRHQWLNSQDVNTDYTYVSPRGEMKVVSGDSFSTGMTFTGVLPFLPDAGTYDRGVLYSYVDEIYNISDLWSLSDPDTYWQGKNMGMLAQLIPIAEQVGHLEARDRFIQALKDRLQDWFTAGGSEFFYNSTWDYLVGFPASFNSDGELNDHDFHWGYFIQAAAAVARYDQAWASDSQWGAMVKLLIKDVANSDRNDAMFPFLRSFDCYAGHDWANGPALFASGNNEESSSEAINFAAGVILFGINTGDTELRDLGIFLYTNMVQAIEQYWFDVDNQTFPPEFEYPGVGIVWSSGGAHATWFGDTPEYIYGINFLPFTGASLYLGHRPEYVRDLYDQIVYENGGVENDWVDIIWSYQALYDPAAALAKFGSGNYTVFAGESKAHTYHWLHNLNALGHVDSSITADIPTCAVFNKNGTRTYVAYNPDSTARTVHFSNGVSLVVPARSTIAGNGTN
jgi:endoglucanase Acf2